LDTFYVNGYPDPIHLAIEAGVTFEFAEGKGISTENDGSLSAVGTAEAPITFTGVVQQPGSWKGVAFWSDSADNLLEHVIIEYGGSAHWNYQSDGTEANLTLNTTTNDASLTLRDSTLRASGNWGIYIDDGGVLRDCANVLNADGGNRSSCPYP
jgi:hypothetical protein